MKRIYILLFLVTLFSCTKIEKRNSISINKSGVFLPKVEQRSVIKGQVDNFLEFKNESKTITLTFYDIILTKRTVYFTEIDDSGKFMFDIPLYHSTNTSLDYIDGSIKLYIFPNDTLFVNCKIRTIDSLIDINASSYDAEHEQFQKDFQKEDYWFRKEITKYHKNISKNHSYNEIKKYCLDSKKALQEKIETRIKNKQKNKFLYDYLTHSVTYRMYTDIIRASNEGVIEDKKERELFYSFLTDSIVFNKEAFITNEYASFLNFYSSNVEKDLPNNVFYSGKTDEQVKRERVANALEIASKLRTGIWKDFLIARKINTNIINNIDEISSLSSLDYFNQLVEDKVSDKYIQQLLISMINKERATILGRNKINLNLDSEVKEVKPLTLADSLYMEILKNNKNKVIYMDFWGTWCSACIKEFPSSNKLHEKFVNKDVSFVYLCCESKKGIFENVIRKHKLKGQHYFLTHKQYQQFQNQFQFKGLPRYVLIDKYGKVNNANATRPSNPKTETFLNKLISE